MTKNINKKELICTICGKKYLSGKKDGLFCSMCCQNKSYRINHKVELSIKGKQYRANNKEKIKEWESTNKEKNINKYQARHAVYGALRYGKITKPSICELCNKESKSIEAHHYMGYEKEHWLDIVWVCKECHKK